MKIIHKHLFLSTLLLVLFIANLHCQQHNAKVLLDAGANPNYVLGAGLVKIGTPFLDAVKDFRMDLVKVMLDSKKVDTEYRFDSYAEKSIKFRTNWVPVDSVEPTLIMVKNMNGTKTLLNIKLTIGNSGRHWM